MDNLPDPFDLAMNVVFRHEGGYTVDHAGPTNYGITVPTLRDAGLDINRDGDINGEDIRSLTPEAAKRVYRRLFWDKFRYGELQTHVISTKIFDLCVNMGPKAAHKIAQRACRACEHRIEEDGIIGDQTIDALNNCNPRQLLTALRSEAAGYYRLIVANKPQHEQYINGWLNRAYR